MPDLGDPDPVRAPFRARCRAAAPTVALSPRRSRRRWVDPLQRRFRGVLATETALFIRRGWLVSELIVVPHERTQSLALKQGPIQRALGLADVAVHSTKGVVRPVAQHLGVADAVAVADVPKRAGRAPGARFRRRNSGWRRWVCSMTAPSSASKPGRLSIGVVGAGRVGASFGASLRRGGHESWAPPGYPRRRSPASTPCCPGCRGLDVEDVVRRAELVFLDSARRLRRPNSSRVSPRWARGVPASWWRTVRAAWGSTPCAAATAAGAIPLAIHPAMTFTGTSLDLDRMVGATFAVTRPHAFLPDCAGARGGDGRRAGGARGRGAAALPRGAGARREPRGDAGVASVVAARRRGNRRSGQAARALWCTPPSRARSRKRRARCRP